jgi:hypothetical protein
MLTKVINFLVLFLFLSLNCLGVSPKETIQIPEGEYKIETDSPSDINKLNISLIPLSYELSMDNQHITAPGVAIKYNVKNKIIVDGDVRFAVYDRHRSRKLGSLVADTEQYGLSVNGAKPMFNFNAGITYFIFTEENKKDRKVALGAKTEGSDGMHYYTFVPYTKFRAVGINIGIGRYSGQYSANYDFDGDFVIADPTITASNPNYSLNDRSFTNKSYSYLRTGISYNHITNFVAEFGNFGTVKQQFFSKMSFNMLFGFGSQLDNMISYSNDVSGGSTESFEVDMSGITFRPLGAEVRLESILLGKSKKSIFGSLSGFIAAGIRPGFHTFLNDAFAEAGVTYTFNLL